MPLGRGRTPGNRVSTRNAIKEYLVKNKNDTKRRKMEKGKGIDIIEAVVVDEFNGETKDYDRKDSD